MQNHRTYFDLANELGIEAEILQPSMIKTDQELPK